MSQKEQKKATEMTATEFEAMLLRLSSHEKTDVLLDMKTVLDRLATKPHIVGTVTRVLGDRMIVDGKREMERIKDAKVGDTAYMIPDTGQAINIIRPSLHVGPVMVVRSVGNGYIEIGSDGSGMRTARCDLKGIDAGDRVVMDLSGEVALQNLGKEKSKQRHVVAKPITWEEIGGQEEAKLALREAIELPHAHRELFAGYGKKGVKGLLMYGPPGCGKTLLGRAAASALARTHGASGSDGFIYVKGPEILSKWVGESEQHIRELFVTAREHKKTHGYPALIFIDEGDAILGARGSQEHGRVLGATLIPQFLSEMDGLDESGAVVIIATNRPDVLDPAVVRDGRVDRKVRVARPAARDAEEIFGIHMRGVPVADSLEEVIHRGVRELYDDGRILVEGMALRLGDAVSGAMIAGVIEQATTRALLRDIDRGHRTKAGGITPDDVAWSVDKLQEGMRHLDHNHLLQEKLHA